MKIYTKITLDMETLEVIEEESFEYEGPVAMCGPVADVVEDVVGAVGDVVGTVTKPFREAVDWVKDITEPILGETLSEITGDALAIAVPAMAPSAIGFGLNLLGGGMGGVASGAAPTTGLLTSIGPREISKFASEAGKDIYKSTLDEPRPIPVSGDKGLTEGQKAWFSANRPGTMSTEFMNTMTGGGPRVSPVSEALMNARVAESFRNATTPNLASPSTPASDDMLSMNASGPSGPLQFEGLMKWVGQKYKPEPYLPSIVPNDPIGGFLTGEESKVDRSENGLLDDDFYHF